MTFTESFKKSEHFIEEIVDGMFDWVRVIDLDNNIIYMNKAMSESLNNPGLGKKCYEILGRDEPCSNCTLRKMVFDGHSHEKEEHINGRIFSVMSSPIRNKEGKIIAAVEVLRDTTQVKQLYEKTKEQNMEMKKDLEIARKLQISLLPGTPSDPRFDFSMMFMPCESLGGDFLDIFDIDGSHLGLYIADVSGHGVQAALLTVFLRSTLDRKLLSPARALEELHAEFNRSKLDLDENLYISVFYTIIDLDKKIMVYSNAGLNVIPIVYNKNGIDMLRLPGIPISNWAKVPGYKDASRELRPGDKLFLYSDGILEMRNAANEQYGEERLLDILHNNDLKPRELLQKIKESAFDFAGLETGGVLKDDVTMALLEIK
ncbi:MAG: SpoIIE family protein phosphatase [Bacillota bacterium]